MAQQSYRNTTLGKSLEDSLDELIQNQRISPQLAQQVLVQFEKTANTALANRVRNRVNFRGHLKTYKFRKDGWRFFMKNVEFRDVANLVLVDNVKIVASEGKSEATP